MIGLETDLLVNQGLVVSSNHGDIIVMDSPDRRDFWYGHGFVLLSEPNVIELTELIADGRRRFGSLGVTRFVIQWEHLYPDAPRITVPEGAVIDRTMALVFKGEPPPDDTRAVDLTGEMWIEAGRLVRDEYAQSADFMSRRLDDLRGLVDRGCARVVGVIEDGCLRSIAGIVRDSRNARFMMPVTQPAARRRGYFSACARTLINWALQDAKRQAVIVVDPIEGPLSLYRNLGFVPTSYVESILVPASEHQ